MNRFVAISEDGNYYWPTVGHNQFETVALIKKYIKIVDAPKEWFDKVIEIEIEECEHSEADYWEVEFSTGLSLPVSCLELVDWIYANLLEKHDYDVTVKAIPYKRVKYASRN